MPGKRNVSGTELNMISTCDRPTTAQREQDWRKAAAQCSEAGSWDKDYGNSYK